MEIALTKGNSKITHHLKTSPIRGKDDLSYQKRGERFQISPLDDTQRANISSIRNISNPRKQNKATSAYRDNTSKINKRPQITRKTQSKEVKNTHRLNQNKNTKTM